MVLHFSSNNRVNVLERLIVFCSVFLLFLTLNPFPVWETYRGGIFSSSGIPVTKIIYFVVIALGMFYALLHSRMGNDIFISVLSLIAAGVILILFSGVMQGTFPALLAMNIIVLAIMLYLSTELKIEIYDKFRAVFAILLIPGIFFSIIAFLGINFPHDILVSDTAIKTNNYVQYLHYPFAVQITKSYDVFGNLNRFRLCGLFDEPGRVGTMCALFLASENYNLKKKTNKLLLVEGILSLSVAFFLLSLVYFLIDAIINRNKKKFYIILGLVIAFVVFRLIPFNNIALQTLQDRMSFSSGRLVGDNRANDDFIAFIESFFRDTNVYNVLFGFGSGNTYNAMTTLNNGYASSFLALFSDFGIVGFTAIILWPIIFWKVNRKNNGKSHTAFILVLIFLINLYQRPSAFSPSYMFPLIGGICLLNKSYTESYNAIEESRR